ncbi:hypothetical protein HPB51_027033 [Rhipicephalus microplus]|uniref:Uncharacterized protein n=1 Tax=Rhipicephalus microplus TaxID=6941 RepID=A0A9J6D1D6_RHIMP|nr:hypothetical protein HPB51_027033 [Rhipicephalus microplus]
MDVAEAEEAARGTEETRKQAGLSSDDAPKRGPPADQQPEADVTGPPCTQPVGQGSLAAKERDAGERDLPTPQGAASEVDWWTGTMGKASKGGDLKSPKDLQSEKSGVQAPTSLAVASKRPHPPNSNDCPEETLAGVEEPPARGGGALRALDGDGRTPHRLRRFPAISADIHLGTPETWIYRHRQVLRFA